jgi:hypothetical protein
MTKSCKLSFSSFVQWSVKICPDQSISRNSSRLQGNENIGMAMTFTLVSHLREQLSHLVRARAEKRRQEDMERERLALEVSA